MGQAPFVLYGTFHCHLCEEAARVLADAGVLEPGRVDEQDIALDDALFEQYGTRIPVLHRRSDGRDLDWPFTAEDAARFVTVTTTGTWQIGE